MSILAITNGGLKLCCSCCFPDILEKKQPFLTYSALWDCLALSLIKYFDDILTKLSYFCAVLSGKTCPWSMFIVHTLKSKMIKLNSLLGE